MNIKKIEKFCPICNQVIDIFDVKSTSEFLKKTYTIEHIDVATSVARIRVECINHFLGYDDFTH